MKNRLAWMFVSVVSFAIPTNACHITTCEHGSVCGLDDERAREDSCRMLCDRLVTCGNVAGGDHEGCMSTCFGEWDRSPGVMTGACRCVSRASCGEIAGRQCPGAPPIGGGYTPGSTTTTGSTSTTGSTTTTGSVTTGSTTSGSGAGGGSGSSSSSSSTTSGSGGQPGSGGAPGHDGGGTGGAPASDAGLGMCGD